MMKHFKNKIKPTPLNDSLEKTSKKEEWIWVEGYKGTDKDMCCRGFQYETGKQFDMPDDASIEECESGFHLCLSLLHVFEYYPVGERRRFFKVKALVRRSDYESYGKFFDCHGFLMRNNKLTSKSIVFLSEFTRDEILADTIARELPEEYRSLAIETDISSALHSYKHDTLVHDGYSDVFASYIIDLDLFEKAHAVGTQKDMSMDMKVMLIFK